LVVTEEADAEETEVAATTDVDAVENGCGEEQDGHV